MRRHAGRGGTLLMIALLVAGRLARRWLGSGLSLQSSPEPQDRRAKKDDKKDKKDRKKDDEKDKKGKGRRARGGDPA